SPLPGLRISETRETTEGSAELEFRIQFPPADSPSLSGFRLRPRKEAGFRPFWRPCGAAVSAETRKAQQHGAKQRWCLFRANVQCRSAGGRGFRDGRHRPQMRRVSDLGGAWSRIGSGKAEQDPLILPGQWQT